MSFSGVSKELQFQGIHYLCVGDEVEVNCLFSS